MDSEKQGLTRKQIALIHVAKKQLGLNEDDYRAAVQTYGGAGSSKDLSRFGFKNLMKHLEKCGFKSTGESSRPGMATPAQLRKITAAWFSLEGRYFDKGAGWPALRGFLKKRFGVDHTRFLTFKKAHQVIEAIKRIQKGLEKDAA